MRYAVPMRIVTSIATVVGLAGCTEMPVCPPVDEHRIGADDDGPNGFSAEEVLALVGGEHVFDVAPDPD
jgi:hypothetical protein